MPAKRIALVVAALMFAASIGAVALRPNVKMADARSLSLEEMVPRRFGEWREDASGPAQIVNPQFQEIVDKVYNQVLSRVYVSEKGYRIMLSLAYGSDDSGTLKAHRPELCYPAQGFVVSKNDRAVLKTVFGEIQARRLSTASGPRREPVTYWFTVGDRPVENALQRRLAQLSLALTGRIPDGMVFRVSSIDPSEDRAWEVQERFIEALLGAVAPPERLRLSGLGAPAPRP